MVTDVVVTDVVATYVVVADVVCSVVVSALDGHLLSPLIQVSQLSSSVWQS